MPEVRNLAAERALEGLFLNRRSLESERRPWLLWSVSFVIALSMLGYPIAASLAQILDLESTATSYPYRIIVAGFSLVVLVGGGGLGHFRVPWLVAGFMIVYLIRLVWDSEFAMVPNAERDLLFYVSSVFLPTFAMCSAHFYYEERNLTTMFTVIGVLACLMIIYALLFTATLTGDVDLTKRNYFESLNPITIGYTGLMTIVSGFTLRKFLSPGQRLLLAYPVMALGVVVFLLGGSRGPLVSAVLFFGLLALVRGRGTVALLLLIVAALGIATYTSSELIIFERFTNLSTDGAVLERLYFQQLAWDAAIANPLMGSAYVELNTLSYPHNLALEAAMALGLGGAIVILGLQFMLGRDLMTMLRNGHILMPMIGTSALANAWISGSLVASRDFYMALTLCWLIAKRIRAEEEDRMREQVLVTAKRRALLRTTILATG